MDTNRSNTGFIERYGTKKMDLDEKKYMPWIKIGICLLFYGITMLIQFQFQFLFGINIGGIAAQFQVMISTYLVISVKKQGYLIAIAMNMVVSVMVAFVVFGNGNTNAIPGVIVPICTIITISIISFYEKSLDAKLEEVSQQKEELADLYEELTTSEKEIIKQNILMTEYDNEIKKREIRENYFAYIDILTELPNRKMIIEKLDQFVEIAHNEKINFAVIFMDLDDFKRINTSKGYRIGDLLLKEIVARIKSVIHEDDIMGRLVSDEFALIIRRNLEEEEIYEYVERIRLSLSECFIVEKMEFNISASFGISIFPRDGINSEELLNYS
ncbi:GGDEF domain-containing protein [Acetobacterium tundrae]|uniref:Diguanylate cyclase n=1 Tax=Acetobacterium tundrae TaxID=132932 RepID=A0ABR6WI02_9FIRM|nr:GGDEF domain-containing protein [Acetobacterium tundrae]MBC3796095.1 diguanylate cyclase [Acetobacterium tundrae]